MKQTPIVTLGILADTHIPDRALKLHPRILPIFQEAGVTQILHAGDISSHNVLEQLAQVAPVTAVRGNRDVLVGPLKMVEMVKYGGVEIAVMHGHGGWGKYLLDKLQFLRYGYQLDLYLRLLTESSGAAKVVIFGHTHYAELFWHNGKLLFNPGAAIGGKVAPSVGLLRIYTDQQVKGKIIPLRGYVLKNRQWAAVQSK